MVDRNARDKLAELLERMLRGELTVHRYEEDVSSGKFNHSGDRAVVTVYHACDDIGDEGEDWRDHVFTNARYSERTICKVRRAAMFLRTDLEYQWPDILFRHSADHTVAYLFATFVATLVTISSGLAPFVFVFGCLAAVLRKFIQDWREPRRFDEQIRQHRIQGREFEAWPFLHRRDFLPGSEDLISPSDDPHAAPESVR